MVVFISFGTEIIKIHKQVYEGVMVCVLLRCHICTINNEFVINTILMQEHSISSSHTCTLLCHLNILSHSNLLFWHSTNKLTLIIVTNSKYLTTIPRFLYSQSPDVLGLPLVPCSRVTYLGNQGTFTY